VNAIRETGSVNQETIDQEHVKAELERAKVDFSLELHLSNNIEALVYRNV